MRPNQRVTLELPEADPPERYRSRIEGVDPEFLTLAAPLRNGAPLPVHVGDRLRVTLFHAGGAHAFDTTVVGRAGSQAPLLRVERPRRLEAMQRRQYFREPAVVKTLCSTPGGTSQIRGVTRNLGGGGVCLRTKDLVALRALTAEHGPDEPFWLEIVLPDDAVQTLARLCWVHPTEDGTAADLAFEFLDLAAPERERLIRYLFMLQREALRKGL